MAELNRCSAEPSAAVGIDNTTAAKCDSFLLRVSVCQEAGGRQFPNNL